MGLIERLLCKVLRYIDIKDETTDITYLRRWFVFPLNPVSKKWAGRRVPRLYVHKFYRGDKDRDLHDHPWPFRSLILKGGYWEHSFNPEWLKLQAQQSSARPETPEEAEDRRIDHNCGGLCPCELCVRDHTPQTVRKWYRVGSILRRGAKWSHRVELPPGKTAWTLFLTGKKERNWGFHTDKGWCWHKFYENGVCWCYDAPEKKESANG